MPTTNAPGGEVCTMMTVSGTYTCNSTRVYVQSVAPGGTGQDGTATLSGGGGSGGMALLGQYFPVAPGTVLTIQIGAVGRPSGTTTVSGALFPTLVLVGGRCASGASNYGESNAGPLGAAYQAAGGDSSGNHGVFEGQWVGGGTGGSPPAAAASDDGREGGARCGGIAGGLSGHDATGQNAGAGGASSPFGNGGKGGNSTSPPIAATGYGAGGGGGARGSANLAASAGSPSFVVLCS